MADNDAVRQRIIGSVFTNRKDADGNEETYVAHVKIWEDGGTDDGAQKPRYILLSERSDGVGFIHKSKLNTNGSFSIGKTWQLSQLRGVEVLDPMMFNITVAKTYRWQTENAREQQNFIFSMVNLYKSISGGGQLKLVGANLDAPSSTRQPIEKEFIRTPTPTNGSLLGSSPRGSRTNGVEDLRSESPAMRGGAARGRAASPMANGQPYRDQLTPARPASPARTDGGMGRTRPTRRPSQDAYDGINPEFNSARARPPSPAMTEGVRPARSRLHVARPPSPAQTDGGGRQRPRRPSNADALTPLGRASPMRPGASTSTRAAADVSTSSPNLQAPPVSNGFTPRSHPEPPRSETPDRDSQLRAPSPAPSTSSAGPRPSATARSRPGSPTRASTAGMPRIDANIRISFYDHANQAVLDRVLHIDPTNQTDEGGEEEQARDTMASVEEMLEGYEWASGGMAGRLRGRGAADQIEANLLDELMALEKANIYAFLEEDERLGAVLKYMDEAIKELDDMDGHVSSYKIMLNSVSDDISHIQSQNRGLQVQTQNQRALLNELEQLLQTVQVDRAALTTLTQESLEKASGIQRLEEALTELYKALQAGRDNDMAATMERLDEYRTHNAQFCKRLFDFLCIMFTAQASHANILLGDNKGVTKSKGKKRFVLSSHQEFEQYLGRYAGLMLYLREMDESVYAKICAAYFSAASDLHQKQTKAFFSLYLGCVKKSSDDDKEQDFTVPATATLSRSATGIRRAGTIVRSPLDARREKDNKVTDGDLPAAEVLDQALGDIAPLLQREQEFIADFLQINDAALTFADYMGLDNYFRRQATRSAGLNSSTQKLVRGALDLIFGFLPAELKSFIDGAIAKDNNQIVGFILCLERSLEHMDDRTNGFLMHLLEKQQQRLKGLFERSVDDQIRSIEAIKLNSKKRRGVAQFIKFFPVYVSRMEVQLLGADGLEIRGTVDGAYEKIVTTMFESLKQMAKLDGEGEDKGQLNYHVILIENMHYFVAEMSTQELGSVTRFIKRAEGLYDENLSAYVKIVLRRPFAKIIDYFDGIERLLKTTAPTEVSSNSSYNKSALKKVVKEFNGKDVRKHVDTLFKRVEKHFTEASEKTTTEETSSGIAPGTVLVGVWRACEEELLRLTDVYGKRIAQCYPDSGVSLEYGAVDVEAAFKRHRVGN